MREMRLSNYADKRKAHHERRAGYFAIAALAMGVSSILLFLATESPVAFAAAFPAFVMGIATGRENRWARIFEIGLEGERALAGALRRILDDRHIAFFNVPLVGAGDLDCLVVGPTGVKAIEVKNHVGVISARNGSWHQIKTGRRGTVYAGGLRNPSGQLTACVRRLKDQLAQGGFGNVWVDAAIVFTNPAARLGQIDMDPSLLRVLTRRALPRLFEGGERMDEQTRDRIEACIQIHHLLPDIAARGGNTQRARVSPSGLSLNTATRQP